MERVAIIVLNWNGLADTKASIASLLDQTYSNYQIFLVDNGSSQTGTDKYFKDLAKNKKITIHKNPSNLGFTGGVNSIAKKILQQDYDYIALLNNDAVADKNWLNELVKAAKKHSSGITTGQLLHADEPTIDGTGDFYSHWGLPFPRDRNLPVASASNSGEVFSGSGGALLYSTAMLKQIGLYDDKFFAYYEDIDLGFRAQLMGYKVYYTNKARVYHKRGATSDKVPGLAVRHTFKNLPLLFIKNVPGQLFFSVGIRFALAYTLLLGNAIRNGNFVPAVRGCLEALWLVPTHALGWRFKIQARRTVDIATIKAKLHPDLPPEQTGLRKFRNLFKTKV